MLFPTLNIATTIVEGELFRQKELSLSVLRLDTIHPVVSGNKLFKLHYFLQHAIREAYEGITTFGGAYSNHLVATASACREAGLKCTGIIRGESPLVLSPTLNACVEYGMVLKFISRQEYDRKESPAFLKELMQADPHHLLVPEGGYDPMGASGAALIMDFINRQVSHICVAIGTATTFAGLLGVCKKGQRIIGIPVLKNLDDMEKRMAFLTKQPIATGMFEIKNDYHFGGYAKKTAGLIQFMNKLFDEHQVPTDFVYTGKMMYAVFDCIEKDFFPKGSKIVCIHTGGLQGNLSLPPGTLVF
ncbi:MAG: pyridoxal-phosphate dependent enzyme [Ferruginibacter sp.]